MRLERWARLGAPRLLQSLPAFAYGDGIRLDGVLGGFTGGMIKVVAVLGSEMEISKDLAFKSYSWRLQRRVPRVSLRQSRLACLGRWRCRDNLDFDWGRGSSGVCAVICGTLFGVGRGWRRGSFCSPRPGGRKCR